MACRNGPCEYVPYYCYFISIEYAAPVEEGTFPFYRTEDIEEER